MSENRTFWFGFGTFYVLKSNSLIIVPFSVKSFCPDFGHCPNIKLSGTGPEVERPRNERVRISDVDCIKQSRLAEFVWILNVCHAYAGNGTKKFGLQRFPIFGY